MLKRRNTPRMRTGFTLVEILIVVTILGLLAAIVTVQVGNAASKTTLTAFVADLRVLSNATILHNAQRAEYLPGDAPGTMPAAIRSFLVPHERFERLTPLGGRWDVNRSELGVTSAVGVVFTGDGPTRDDDFMQEVDRMIDDGDLTTGIFRKLADKSYYHVLVN